MKGPYERLKYSMLRIWECPECSRRERTDGKLTSMLCDCVFNESKKMQPMRLVEDDIRRIGAAAVAAAGTDAQSQNGTDEQNDV